MVSFVFCLKQMTSYEMRISDWSQTCALPICCIVPGSHHWPICRMLTPRYWAHPEAGGRRFPAHSAWLPVTNRSEEHTSELQSLMRISYAVFCLKKKTKTNQR